MLSLQRDGHAERHSSLKAKESMEFWFDDMDMLLNTYNPKYVDFERISPIHLTSDVV